MDDDKITELKNLLAKNIFFPGSQLKTLCRKDLAAAEAFLSWSRLVPRSGAGDDTAFICLRTADENIYITEAEPNGAAAGFSSSAGVLGYFSLRDLKKKTGVSAVLGFSPMNAQTAVWAFRPEKFEKPETVLLLKSACRNLAGGKTLDLGKGGDGTGYEAAPDAVDSIFSECGTAGPEEKTGFLDLLICAVSYGNRIYKDGLPAEISSAAGKFIFTGTEHGVTLSAFRPGRNYEAVIKSYAGSDGSLRCFSDVVRLFQPEKKIIQSSFDFGL